MPGPRIQTYDYPTESSDLNPIAGHPLVDV